jgi:hypothetical protein
MRSFISRDHTVPVLNRCGSNTDILSFFYFICFYSLQLQVFRVSCTICFEVGKIFHKMETYQIFLTGAEKDLSQLTKNLSTCYKKTVKPSDRRASGTSPAPDSGMEACAYPRAEIYGFYPGSGNNLSLIQEAKIEHRISAWIRNIVKKCSCGKYLELLLLSRTGAKKRAFHSESPPVWPVFKWAHDDKFFARMTQVKYPRHFPCFLL